MFVNLRVYMLGFYIYFGRPPSFFSSSLVEEDNMQISWTIFISRRCCFFLWKYNLVDVVFCCYFWSLLNFFYFLQFAVFFCCSELFSWNFYFGWKLINFEIFYANTVYFLSKKFLFPKKSSSLVLFLFSVHARNEKSGTGAIRGAFLSCSKKLIFTNS